MDLKGLYWFVVSTISVCCCFLVCGKEMHGVECSSKDDLLRISEYKDKKKEAKG